MKKRLLTFAVLIISLTITSTSFAQDDTGGSAGGGTGGTSGGGTTVVAQPTAIHFTRNNGDGTCGMQAQIRMYYTTAPTAAPVLTQIWYNGAPLYSNFTPVTGDISNYATKGYVSFCLPTSNIPPAIKLTLDYSPSATQTATISGTD
ncbi:MAG TPA: hypothetical protein VMY77_15655 [Chitinophagaceae bacterium]|nr:hypothetical protein [Chitinophagaceae bacterium]